MAEIIHHIFLKHGGQSTSKNLFSKETAEKFHLIACFIYNVDQVNSERFIKYVNFLRLKLL